MTRALRLPVLVALASLLASPASAADETVVMNLEEFLKLYEQTRNPTTPDPVAPHEFTVTSASYDGTVLRDDAGEPTSAVFDAVFHVEVLKDEGWVKIPLLPRDVAVQSATIGGREASVMAVDRRLALVTDRRGSFDVKVRFAAKVHTKEGRSSFQFTPAHAAAASIKLSVPSHDSLDFSVAQAKLQSDEVRGDLRVVEASIPGTAPVSVSWQREIPETEAAEARLNAIVYTLVGFGDGLLTARASIDYAIAEAGVNRFDVRLPEGTTLLDVHGAAIRDWAVADGLASVTLNYAAEGSYRLGLTLEQVIGEGDAAAGAPLVQPVGVTRSKGWVGVEARGTLEVAAGEHSGVTPVDVRALPARILGITDQPVLLGFKYLGEGASLPLHITEHDDVDVLVTLLDTADARTMFTDDGRRLTSVEYTVRNNRKQFLRLKLPEGAELWSASVAGKAVQPAAAADGRILLPLVRSQASGGSLAAFSVGLVYVEQGAAPAASGVGSFRAELPTADVPITHVGWTVYAPDRAKIRKKSRAGSLRAVDHRSNPFRGSAIQALGNVAPNEAQAVQRGGGGQLAGDAMGEGAVPVAVHVPLEGTPVHFEKLLALGETLWVGFDYRGLR